MALVVLVGYLKWPQEVGKMVKEYNPTGFAKQIFNDRYTIHEGETFSEGTLRLAEYVSNAEQGIDRKKYSKRFQEILLTNRFSAGGRIWRGAGRKKSAMINCFVLPVYDSREAWGELLKNVTIISGLGGGIGISFGNIRPRGTKIQGTGGVATGAVSLMKMVNAICNELREGGGRRSALLFGLPYNHPDIEEFLHVKLDKHELSNANISVLIDNEFLDLVKSNGDISLVWAGKEVKTVKAKWIYDKVVENSLKSGDPGFLNMGFAEIMNNLSYCRKLSCANPCGEQILPEMSICCLGNIILPTHLSNKGEIDWGLLDDTIRLAVRFLDNVLDVNEYPIAEIKEVSEQERRIGLGIMGLHDMLLKMGIKYSSDEALKVIDKIMSFIKKKAYETSIFLSVEKGQFPLLDRAQFIQSGFCKQSLTPSMRKKILEYGIRNCCILTAPPTGTTSIVSGVSSGIEPMFAPIYQRNFNKHQDTHSSMTNKSKEVVIHPLVKEFLKANKSIDHFEAAHDISPEHHCKIQEICQRHIDSAVSKTINLPGHATTAELSDIILEYLPRLKGLTIYRDGSRGESPLMPMPIGEIKKYLNDDTVIQSGEGECPSGSCDI